MFEFGPPFLEPQYERTIKGVTYDVFLIANPITSDTLDHLFGKDKVSIDGITREVIGIERFMHLPPYFRGESMGLVCVKITDRVS